MAFYNLQLYKTLNQKFGIFYLHASTVQAEQILKCKGVKF